MFDDSVVDSPMYSHTNAADTPRMNMEEYDSAMTDMLMSIGVDKFSAQKCAGQLSRNLMRSLMSMAEVPSSTWPTTLVDQLVLKDYMRSTSAPRRPMDDRGTFQKRQTENWHEIS